MDRVTVEDIDDSGHLQHEAAEVNLAEMPTEDAVRYLVSHGTAEMDARFLVAMAKGTAEGDARVVEAGSEAHTP